MRPQMNMLVADYMDKVSTSSIFTFIYNVYAVDSCFKLKLFWFAAKLYVENTATL